MEGNLSSKTVSDRSGERKRKTMRLCRKDVPLPLHLLVLEDALNRLKHVLVLMPYIGMILVF